MSDIKVIDNFLEHDEFSKIKNIISTDMFPWFYNDFICSAEKEKDLLNNCMFTHSVYRKDTDVKKSAYFDLFENIINKLNITSLTRIKLNLMLKTDNPIVHCMHTDYDEDYYNSAILYFENNNGGTVFENDKFIQNKENRIVLFKSNMKHSGVSQTNTKKRTVLNIVYI